VQRHEQILAQHTCGHCGARWHEQPIIKVTPNTVWAAVPRTELEQKEEFAARSQQPVIPPRPQPVKPVEVRYPPAAEQAKPVVVKPAPAPVIPTPARPDFPPVDASGLTPPPLPPRPDDKEVAS
jgi:hypothetical protein